MIFIEVRDSLIPGDSSRSLRDYVTANWAKMSHLYKNGPT